MNPKLEIEKLKAEIERHNHRYYVLNDPEVTDKEFDELLQRLKKLEALHPDLVTSDSPTQRVGGIPSDVFDPHPHSVPMLSLDNAYTPEELTDWWNRAQKNLKHVDSFEVTVEPKMDGV